MNQCIRSTLSRQLTHYRQHAVQAPELLNHATLAHANVLQALADANTQWRERMFPPHVTLWAFLLQVLSADGSCREAVTRVRAFRAAQGQPLPSANTGSYCKARRRLPEAVLARLAKDAGHLLSQQTPDTWQWKGRRVKIVDGSSVSMPDTEANQTAFPQPLQQQEGLGFPTARLLGILCLASGAWLSLATAPQRGKITGETALLRQLSPTLRAGDVILADRCYSSYFMIAELSARGVDYVGKQHQRRKADFRRARRLGREDHVIRWAKPVRPPWMDDATYQQMPEHLEVRECRLRVSRKGFRTKVLIVVTTLLDATVFSKADLTDLYRSRWHIELDLRSIKTAMGMDIVRGKTPDMVRKELWMFMLAYNLIRAVMAKAAKDHAVLPRTLSFTGALQAVNIFCVAWLFAGPVVRKTLLEVLYITVAAHRVGQRLGRIEPRAVKRRPKPYRLLTVPRHEARRRLVKTPCA